MLQSKIAAGVFVEEASFADVLADHLFGFVAGMSHDDAFRRTRSGSLRGESCPEGVSAIRVFVEASSRSAALNDECDGLAGKCGVGDIPMPIYATENRPVIDSGGTHPVSEAPDRTCGRG